MTGRGSRAGRRTILRARNHRITGLISRDEVVLQRGVAELVDRPGLAQDAKPVGVVEKTGEPDRKFPSSRQQEPGDHIKGQAPPSPAPRPTDSPNTTPIDRPTSSLASRGISAILLATMLA